MKSILLCKCTQCNSRRGSSESSLDNWVSGMMLTSEVDVAVSVMMGKSIRTYRDMTFVSRTHVDCRQFVCDGALELVFDVLKTKIID